MCLDSCVVYMLQHEGRPRIQGCGNGRCARVQMWIHSTGIGARGGAVVEALRYNPEGRRIDSRWCHWNFSLK
jgi:hypothetical protein